MITIASSLERTDAITHKLSLTILSGTLFCVNGDYQYTSYILIHPTV